MRHTQHIKRVSAMLFAFTVIVAGCGSDDDDDSSVDQTTEVDGSVPDGSVADGAPNGSADMAGDGEPSGPPEQSGLTVGILPINDVIPLQAAISDGTFESNGLTISTENAAGGAAIVPGVVAGDFDIGYSNVFSLMQAAEAGLDVRIIASGPYIGEEDYSAILALDPEIATIADLEGRTVAINTLGNLAEIVLRESMDKAGADGNSVDLIELPLPDMLGALEAGQVDAILTVEPFVAPAVNAGATIVARPIVDAQPDMMISVYFAMGEYIEANPNTIAAFVASINASNEKIQGDRDFANQVLLDSTATPDLEAAEATILPVFKAGLDLDALATSGELALKWGIVGSEPDIDSLVN